MNKIFRGLAAGFLLLAWLPPAVPAMAQSKCLNCHTNDKVMKMLYKPPMLEGGEAEGSAGAPPPLKAEERYKGFLIDAELLKNDPHLRMGCKFCHQGNDAGGSRETAHMGLVKRPSDNVQICGRCHKQIAGAYEKSLHYTTAGLKNGVRARFSAAEAKHFDETVFEASCRKCHASCGDCHVKSPSVGLISGHKFVKKEEGKTCAFCHVGIYSEFTGDYGGNPDVHYKKGMLCMDCHRKTEVHGDGVAYRSKQEVKDRPACVDCHDKLGREKLLTTKIAHTTHRDKVSCQGCHSAGEYRQCYSCHTGAGATARPGFILGLNPRDRKTLTTLRIVPAARDTFAQVGIKMEQYDALPNYWNSPVHNIRKQTDRTRSCDVCHVERSGFLKRETLPENGSRANEGLIMAPRPINR